MWNTYQAVRHSSFHDFDWAVVRAVGCHSPTAEGRVISAANPYENCSGQSDTRLCFFLITIIMPYHYDPFKAPYSSWSKKFSYQKDKRAKLRKLKKKVLFRISGLLDINVVWLLWLQPSTRYICVYVLCYCDKKQKVAFPYTRKKESFKWEKPCLKAFHSV